MSLIHDTGCDIGISCQGWQRGHRWQVRRRARRLLRGDAGLPDGGSSVGGGALGLNGSTNGSSLDCNAGRTGEINPERPVSLNWLSMSDRTFSIFSASVCPFSRAWLLVIRRSLYDLARSWSRAICAGDLRLYPMFCALIRPTWDTVWRGENLILTTTAPDFSSYMFHELRVSLCNKVSKSIRRLPCASIVGKNPNQDLDPLKNGKMQRANGRVFRQELP